MSKSTFFRVSNDSSQAERRQILKDTLHGRALAEQDMVGGRFAAREKSTVVGAGQVAYPQLPETSPWHHDPVPDEPPIGIDVNAVEPTGTHAEIEQSLCEARDGVGQPAKVSSIASPNDEGRAPLGGNLPGAASRRPRRLFPKKG
jgi:hypothetical protein